MRALARTAIVKERVCEYIRNEVHDEAIGLTRSLQPSNLSPLLQDYMKALIDVFHQAEDVESLLDLRALFGCTQTIRKDQILSPHQYAPQSDFCYCSIAERKVSYCTDDPEFPNYKANYRDFLRETSRFRQPIPIRDDMIQRKTHHTYRRQFPKDVVLVRAIDDSTFNVLNSSIIFNQIEIITHVQNDQTFLREIAGMFMDDDLSIEGARAGRDEGRGQDGR